MSRITMPALVSENLQSSYMIYLALADGELARVKERRNNPHGSGRNNLTPIISKRASQRGSGLGSGLIDKGMILPFQPLCLTFANVNYYVPMPAVGSSLPTPKL